MKHNNTEKSKSGCLKKVLFAIIFICLLPLTPFLVLPALIGIWYYSKRKPNSKRRNISIALTLIGILMTYVALQTPNDSVQKNQAITSSSSTKVVAGSSNSSSSSSSSKAKKDEEEKKKVEELKKQEEAKKAEEARKAEEERKAEEARQLIVNAENSVKTLEDNPVSENIPAAQESVDKISDPGKKEELQTRITTAKGVIEQRVAEETRRAEEARQAAAAEAQRQQEAAQVQPQAGGGYYKDARGRWHRPNGQYASRAEIAAAGLQW